MTAIAFALVAMVGWAIGDVFNTYVARGMGSQTAYFWWLVFAAFFSSLYLPFAGPVVDYPVFVGAILLNVFVWVGTLLFFRALERGNASLVGAIAGSFPMVTVGLSLYLYQETLNTFQFLGFFLIIIGLVLASLKISEWRKKGLSGMVSDPGVLPAIGTMIIWGVYFCLIRTPVEKIGWFWAGYPGYWFFVLLLLFGMVKGSGIVRSIRRKRSLFFVAAAGLFAMGANFAYNLGLTAGYTAVVAPIAGSAPVLFVILSRFVFHDRLNRSQAVGIVLSLIGIIFMSIV